jgi:hypothetical protein
MTSKSIGDIQPYTPTNTIGTSLSQSMEYTTQPVYEPRKKPTVEPYTASDLSTLYGNMTNTNINDRTYETNARTYDMDNKITLPPNHPEYKPTMKDTVLHDIKQQVTHQYNTMIITATATLSLGLIAYMVSTTNAN